MLNKLSKVVNLMYKKIYNYEMVKEEKISKTIRLIVFENETIKIDNSVGNKYRITFNDYYGTIEEYRNLIDDILKNNMYCCDTSNFIDLTESFINKLYDNLKD